MIDRLNNSPTSSHRSATPFNGVSFIRNWSDCRKLPLTIFRDKLNEFDKLDFNSGEIMTELVNDI